MTLPKSGDETLFVVHEHHARKLHWDLRLEVPGTKEDIKETCSYSNLNIEIKEANSVLWSFAVPKAKLPQRGERILAIETEPHPIEYKDFEGEIPEKNYGAGKVKIYDKGTVKWKEVSEKKLVFELSGKSITGEFVLVHFKEKNWLWMKKS